MIVIMHKKQTKESEIFTKYSLNLFLTFKFLFVKQHKVNRNACDLNQMLDLLIDKAKKKKKKEIF